MNLMTDSLIEIIFQALCDLYVIYLNVINMFHCTNKTSIQLITFRYTVNQIR